MKRTIALAALATALATATSPAAAQDLSGTVTINGTVGEKCLVTDEGDNADPDFGGIIDLMDLDDTDGTLRTIADISASGDLGNLGFRVVCTTANPVVQVTGTAMTTAGAAPTGYANTVHFTADANFDIAGGGTDTFTVTTDGTDIDGGSLSGRLATGLDNVTVDLSSFHTPDPADVLVAGDYTGSVVITISPS